MKKELKQILFVINPASGAGQKDDFESIISAYSQKEGFDYQIYKTTGNEDKKEIKRYIKSFEPDLVIASGGDGTINLVASELVGSQIKLGLIPSGSANGLAYNLGVPSLFEEALRVNFSGNYIPFDVIRINKTHYCFHLSDVGINARIVKRFEQEGDKGFAGYGKQLFKELFTSRTSFGCLVETDGKARKIKAEMVTVANAHSYGTGVKINPTGNYRDGRFEIVIIKPYPWWFVFTFIYAGFTGKLHKMQYVKVFTASKAKIQFKEKQDFQIDGEVMPPLKKIKLEIIPSALQIVCVEK